MAETLTDEPLIRENEPEVEFPPGDLWSDEPPLESDLHRKQIELLIRLLEWLWRDRTDFYVSGNLTIYYSPNQKKSEEFRGPDFFLVKGCERKERRSWVVWQEDGKYPNVIIEILSESTASTDRVLKKQIYQDIFRTPDYFWFDPRTLELKGFHLLDGSYVELQGNSMGLLWSQQLELYVGVSENRLRFFLPSGELIPLPEEQLIENLEEERQRAEAERQRAEIEKQRADQAIAEIERLKEILKAQGIEIE